MCSAAVCRWLPAALTFLTHVVADDHQCLAERCVWHDADTWRRTMVQDACLNVARCSSDTWTSTSTPTTGSASCSSRCCLASFWPSSRRCSLAPSERRMSGASSCSGRSVRLPWQRRTIVRRACSSSSSQSCWWSSSRRSSSFCLY